MKLYYKYLKSWWMLASILSCLCLGSCSSEVSKNIRQIKYDKREVRTDKLSSGKWKKHRAVQTHEDEPYAYYDNVHPDDLTFDMYKPRTKEKEVLPLVIIVHSGAFIMGDKKNPIVTQMAKDFARTGKYAVASTNYRILDHTRFEDLKNLLSGVSKGYTRHKILEALGDLRSSIKFFIENGDKYYIDTNRIYIVGYSAGAILSNLLIYADVNEIDDYINEFLTDKAINYLLEKMGMDAINEIDNLLAFDYDFSENLKGVVSISGAVMDHRMLDDMDNADVPMLLIHGNEDQIVPFGEDSPFNAYSKKDFRQSYSDFSFKVGVKGHTDNSNSEHIVVSESVEYEVKMESGRVIPKEHIKFFIGLFVTPICGSGCIYDRVFQDSNLRLLEIDDGPHVFMLNENGMYNKTYLKLRQEIFNFLNRNG